ncbi:MAG: HAMP domain-containing sensor histidine kinase [Pseudomonadales bacterium]|jgi:signal transduction histidine kinase|nr:HAMP domain-containing sensor histidine kinase [Pseudomonadales bacterium]
MTDDLAAALRSAERADAVRALRVLAPLLALVCFLESASHWLETPREAAFVAVPWAFGLALAGLAAAVWVRAERVPGLPWWHLLPLATVLVVMSMHLATGTGGVVVHLAATLVATGALIVDRRVRAVALALAWGVYAGWSLRLHPDGGWVYPIVLLPFALAVAAVRRRGLEQAERRRLLERELERKDAELERLGRMADMAAGVTHHFNNLLTGILGGTSSALAALPEDHGVRRDLELVVSSSERAAELVRRLGSYTGRAPREQRRFAARELLEEPLPLEPPAEGVTLTVAADERLPELEGDLRELRQALGDVLRNAVEACAGGGRILLRMAPEPETGSVRLEVLDSGPGLADGVAERMFEPFFTTREPTRLGLGLAFAQGVLRRHGGTLAADNRPEGGTRVTLRLPVAPAAVPAPPRDRSAPRAASAPRTPPEAA